MDYRLTERVLGCLFAFVLSTVVLLCGRTCDCGLLCENLYYRIRSRTIHEMTLRPWKDAVPIIHI